MCGVRVAWLIFWLWLCPLCFIAGFPVHVHAERGPVHLHTAAVDNNETSADCKHCRRRAAVLVVRHATHAGALPAILWCPEICRWTDVYNTG